jgi:hypothetical protein
MFLKEKPYFCVQNISTSNGIFKKKKENIYQNLIIFKQDLNNRHLKSECINYNKLLKGIKKC